MGGALFIVGVIGFVDDIFVVCHKYRFIGQGMAALMVVTAGYSVQLPVLENMVFYAPLCVVLTFIGLIFVTNACNFVDGLNGLLSGNYVILLLFALFILSDHNIKDSAFICLLIKSMICAILGFYIFNFPWGKIFMGDVGSTFLGLFLGIIALMAQDQSPSEFPIFARSFFAILNPMAILWGDVILTLIRRLRRKESIVSSLKDYGFLTLHTKGFKHATISIIHYMMTICIGIITYLWYKGHLPIALVISVEIILFSAYVYFVFNDSTHIKEGKQDV